MRSKNHPVFTRSSLRSLLIGLISTVVVAPVYALEFDISDPAQSPELSSSTPGSAIAADFNGDGFPDVAFAMLGSDGGDGGISILQSNGSGFSGDEPVQDGGFFDPAAVTAADLDGDGHQDLIAVGAAFTPNRVSQLRVYLGDGSGSFASVPDFTAAIVGTPSAVIAGLFNGDAAPDLVVIDGSNTVGALFFAGIGDGTLAAYSDVLQQAIPSGDVAVADFNGDGALDFVTPRVAYLGDGAGSFSRVFPDLVSGRAVAAGDMNNDGAADIVILMDDLIVVYAGDGAGGFSIASTTTPPGTVQYDLVLADFDADSNLDVVVSTNATNPVTVLLGSGDSFLAAPQSFGSGFNAEPLVTGDVNGDGLIDIVTGNDVLGGTPYASVLWQAAPGTGTPTLRFSTATFNAAEGGAVPQITVTRSGDPAIAVSVNYTTANGTATSGADYAATSGTLNFASDTLAASFPVTIIDDANYEGVTETIQLQLNTPGGGAVLGAPSTATLNIADNDTAPINIPNVTGQTEAAARSALGVFTVQLGTSVYDPAVPAGSVISQSPVACSGCAQAGDAVTLVLSLGPQPIAIPNVTGQLEGAARTNVQNADLVVGTVSYEIHPSVLEGSVIRQTPAACGSCAVAGDAVDLVISNGPVGPALIDVPNLRARTVAEATADLVAAGLGIGSVTTGYHSTVAAGGIIRQTPLTCTACASPGDTVDVVVSLGPRPVDIPDVTGQTEANARSGLAIVGGFFVAVTYESHPTVTEGNVIRQSPVACVDCAQQGDAIDLVVSTGAEFDVPNLRAMTVGEATVALVAAGLGLGNVSYVYHGSLAAGKIISQTPPTCTACAASGDTVDVVVSDGLRPIDMPDTTGQTEADARAALSAYTVQLGTPVYSSTVAAGSVVSQSPVACTGCAQPGDTVTLVLSLGPQPASGSIQFSQASFAVAENGASATLTLTRTGGTAGSVSVSYRTSDNASATAGSDYTAGSGTVVFADGVATGVISVGISNDSINESNENFLVELYAPSGGVVLGGAATATVNIIDDDASQAGVLSFNKSTVNRKSTDSEVETKIFRQNGTVGSISVNIVATAGSASTIVRTIQFANGRKDVELKLPINAAGLPALADELAVADHVVFELRSPAGGAVLGNPAILTVVFTDR